MLEARWHSEMALYGHKALLQKLDWRDLMDIRPGRAVRVGPSMEWVYESPYVWISAEPR